MTTKQLTVVSNCLSLKPNKLPLAAVTSVKTEAIWSNLMLAKVDFNSWWVRGKVLGYDWMPIAYQSEILWRRWRMAVERGSGFTRRMSYGSWSDLRVFSLYSGFDSGCQWQSDSIEKRQLHSSSSTKHLYTNSLDVLLLASTFINLNQVWIPRAVIMALGTR